MTVNTILRRDAHGVLEAVVEIKSKATLPPSPKEPYVPKFHRPSDLVERTEWIWKHQAFVDNVYEMLTDHLTTVIDSESDVEVDYGMLQHMLSNHIFDTSVHARTKS
jgi:hypothetical protein